MISLVTVPKTGTIYTLQLLRRWGVDVERKHLENTDEPPYGGERFGPGFPCDSTDEWEVYPESRQVVCTLRDPILAVISELNRGVPNRMISVDGWAVMADWHIHRAYLGVHFFPIPPTRKGQIELASFVNPPGGWSHECDLEPRNVYEDRTGLKLAYHAGRFTPEHPTIQRVIKELAEMPAVENLFADHGFDLPWFAHSLDEREEAYHRNSYDPRELS